MSPIVDGLTQKFGARVDVVRVNAQEGEGITAFRQSGLAGHPSYVLLVPEDGGGWRTVYRAVGIVEAAELERALIEALAAK